MAEAMSPQSSQAAHASPHSNVLHSLPFSTSQRPEHNVLVDRTLNHQSAGPCNSSPAEQQLHEEANHEGGAASSKRVLCVIELFAKCSPTGHTATNQTPSVTHLSEEDAGCDMALPTRPSFINDDSAPPLPGLSLTLQKAQNIRAHENNKEEYLESFDSPGTAFAPNNADIPEVPQRSLNLELGLPTASNAIQFPSYPYSPPYQLHQPEPELPSYPASGSIESLPSSEEYAEAPFDKALQDSPLPDELRGPIYRDDGASMSFPFPNHATHAHPYNYTTREHIFSPPANGMFGTTMRFNHYTPLAGSSLTVTPQTDQIEDGRDFERRQISSFDQYPHPTLIHETSHLRDEREFDHGQRLGYTPTIIPLASNASSDDGTRDPWPPSADNTQLRYENDRAPQLESPEGQPLLGMKPFSSFFKSYEEAQAYMHRPRRYFNVSGFDDWRFVQENLLYYVKRMYQHMITLHPGADSSQLGYWHTLTRKNLDQAVLEAKAWEIVHTAIEQHRDGIRNLEELEINKRLQNDQTMTCSQRVEKLAEILYLDKLVCKDIVSGNNVPYIVACPHAWHARKNDNRRLNKDKGAIMKAGKAHMSMSAEPTKETPKKRGAVESSRQRGDVGRKKAKK
ncbi:MAG: hypothetical protein M1820_009206 [Bogoriella megaspora]|nr:MAG: hypothetical protein M1820_009206 [Bogoriella megaspora]